MNFSIVFIKVCMSIKHSYVYVAFICNIVGYARITKNELMSTDQKVKLCSILCIGKFLR